MHNPPWNKGKKLPAEVLTKREARRLLNQCTNVLRGGKNIFCGPRNKALLTILYRGMLRCQEALSLMQKDVDLEAGTVHILHGKGDKARLIGMDSGTITILKDYEEKRAERGVNGSDHFFCTLTGKPLSGVFVRNLCKQLALRAEIRKRVHPHGLRHTGAVELLKEGVNVVEIQHILGHSSLATTVVYLDHLNPGQIINTMQNRKFKG